MPAYKLLVLPRCTGVTPTLLHVVIIHYCPDAGRPPYCYPYIYVNL